MKKLTKLAITVAFLLPTSVFAYGSIAIDDTVGDDGPAYGLVVGGDSKASAQRDALKICRAHGGENCKSVVWFKTCGAVAVTKKYFGYGYGSTKAAATGQALKMCGRINCNIVASECE